MSVFLVEWEAAWIWARKEGEVVWLWRSWIDENGEYNLMRVGRTMHPSFMGGQVPKWDEERDK